MTPEEELEMLAAQQRRDDNSFQPAEFYTVASLNQEWNLGDGGVKGTLADCFGVDGEGEILNFMPRRHGDVLGHAAQQRGYHRRPTTSFKCAHCEAPFESYQVTQARYCSTSCKKRAWERRTKVPRNARRRARAAELRAKLLAVRAAA